MDSLQCPIPLPHRAREHQGSLGPIRFQQASQVATLGLVLQQAEGLVDSLHRLVGLEDLFLRLGTSLRRLQRLVGLPVLELVPLDLVGVPLRDRVRSEQVLLGPLKLALEPRVVVLQLRPLVLERALARRLSAVDQLLPDSVEEP